MKIPNGFHWRDLTRGLESAHDVEVLSYALIVKGEGMMLSMFMPTVRAILK